MLGDEVDEEGEGEEEECVELVESLVLAEETPLEVSDVFPEVGAVWEPVSGWYGSWTAKDPLVSNGEEVSLLSTALLVRERGRELGRDRHWVSMFMTRSLAAKLTTATSSFSGERQCGDEAISTFEGLSVFFFPLSLFPRFLDCPFSCQAKFGSPPSHSSSILSSGLFLSACCSTVGDERGSMLASPSRYLPR